MNKSVVPLAPNIREICVVTPFFALSCFPDPNNASAKEKTHGTQINEDILSPTSGPVKWFTVCGLWFRGCGWSGGGFTVLFLTTARIGWHSMQA